MTLWAIKTCVSSGLNNHEQDQPRAESQAPVRTGPSTGFQIVRRSSRIHGIQLPLAQLFGAFSDVLGPLLYALFLRVLCGPRTPARDK